ncbi:hypothetical protein MSG28_001314 [Choristoneura fumiferana]|uniref:Uncharacterized protein n=1 Tax=Choristoneura fumiferana TaxID=7141 RepID=A0ACC0KU90_CHOFU|nr:hypothetical protein MSG28_001314 [Choristoneura fumiferana]
MDDQPILNIVSAYAPQVGCPALEKEAFWEDFDEMLQSIPAEECIHIGADLNGHVGASNEAFPNTHGGYGLGRRNREGLDILNFASKYNFKIVNTQFRKNEEHLITYKSAKTIKTARSYPGEAITSQHRLLVAVVNLPKPIRIRRDNTERIKWKELHGDKGIQFINIIKSYLTEDLGRDKTTDKMWQDFEDVCHKQARLTLGVSKGGPPTAKDPTWWNDEIKQIIKAKREAFKLWQKSKLEDDRAEYKTLKVLAKSSVAQARAISRQDFYDRLENATNENQVFKVAKQRYRATLDTKFNKYIKDSHGKLLTSNDAINCRWKEKKKKKRWKEYYEQLLNEEFPSENQITLPSIAGPLECIHPMEIKVAIRKMEHNKALGPDNVPVDIWKLLGEDALPWLTSLFNKIAFEGKIPASSTIEAIQTIRILMEKHRVNKENLYLVFIDLEKAFDRVPRELVWQALRAQEIPEAYITLIQDMYGDVSTQIKSPAGISDPFCVRVGVHQGSTISPLLFNLTMDHITKNIQAEIPWCMLYADDIVLVAKKASELQNTFNTWLRELERHGLRVSRTKTEFMECDFGGSEEIGCDILIDSTALPKVSRFKYLGSMLTTDAHIEEDVNHRVNTAWLKWRSLSGVLCDNKMPIKTKGKIYKTAVRPAMTYGAECWTTLKKHEQKLHTAEMKMLRWAGGVTRLDKVRNEHVRGSFKVAPVAEKLKESRLRWYGHIKRRDESYSVKIALNIPTKPRGKGRPPSTWWTNVERDLKALNISPTTTQDRASWRRRTRRPDPS